MMQAFRKNTSSFHILHGRGIMKHPNPKRIIKAIKTFRCLKRAEQGFLQQISVDYKESIREKRPGCKPRRFMLKRIRKNMDSVIKIRGRLRSLESSKFCPYLNANPKFTLYMWLGVCVFGLDVERVFDGYFE